MYIILFFIENIFIENRVSDKKVMFLLDVYGQCMHSTELMIANKGTLRWSKLSTLEASFGMLL